MRKFIALAFLIVNLYSCKTESVEIESRYDNGQIKEQLITGLDSLPNGYVLKQIYYNEGILKCQGTKVNDSREGKWNCYYKNGELEWSATYKNGREHGLTKCYYPNGTWKKSNVANGQFEGQSTEYNYDSLTQEHYFVEGQYRNGLEHGLWISKYMNGKLMSKTNYINGSKEGQFEQFHKNGNISVKGQFRNNELHDSILVFNDKSEIVRIELFDKGKIYKEIKMQ
jgi:antitoxin component YwqK of YwqJK toxin-antitoxin module